MNECPSPEQLQQFRTDQLPAAERYAFAEHINTCANCQHLLATLPEDEAAGRGSVRFSPASEEAETRRLDPRKRTPTTAAERRPPQVPGYEFLEELGRGGAAVVYKVRHAGLSRIVALKMILVGGQAGAEARLRFLAEAEAIAAVKHPGIVQVYDFGTHDELPFFSLEYC